MKQLYYVTIILLIVSTWTGFAMAQGWQDEMIHALPDESFAVIETQKNGVRIRHSPYLDSKGKLDEEQLIYVLGTLEYETWVVPKNKEVARSILEPHYNRFMEGVKKRGLQEPVNINTAKLTELVALPRIGPVLAVKIAQYRNEHGNFTAKEEIQKIKGIGQGTFNGLRFYIRLE